MGLCYGADSQIASDLQDISTSRPSPDPGESKQCVPMVYALAARPDDPAQALRDLLGARDRG